MDGYYEKKDIRTATDKEMTPIQKLLLLKVSDKLIGLDRRILKTKYQRDEIFGNRSDKAKKVKIRLDGEDIPLYDLGALFSTSATLAKEASSEAMLVKDEVGHMVLVADQIEGVIEAEEEFIEDLSPVFGERSCSYFPKVFVKDGLAVLILNTMRLRVSDSSVDPIWPESAKGNSY